MSAPKNGLRKHRESPDRREDLRERLDRYLDLPLAPVGQMQAGYYDVVVADEESRPHGSRHIGNLPTACAGSRCRLDL
jgi:hypothetical protein